MTTQLNFKKPYGTVYGHASAVFEQGGMLFDGGGNPAEEIEPEAEATEGAMQASDWLNSQLAGGPVAQGVLYKQCQVDGLNWDEVKNASNSMPVKKYKYAQVDTWKLTE